MERTEANNQKFKRLNISNTNDMVEVRKREHETTGAMVRRFTRRVQQSGILVQARKLKFHKGKATKRQSRESALRRITLARERTRLEKLGKALPDKKGRGIRRSPTTAAR